MRVFLVIAAGVGLSACQPAVPDSGSGVGFDSNFQNEQAQRNAALASSGVPASANVPAPSAVSSAPLSVTNDGSAAATAAETARVLAATSPNGTGGVGTTAATNSGVAPLNASPSNPAPTAVNTAGISQENNFDAVAAQRDIQADAARIDANRAQYQQIQPQALPDRGAAGPNIVAFALSNTHPVGTQVYSRFGFNKASKATRACANYSSPVEAQIAFLEDGGPEKDRAGMDPDGDGYACAWDPAPFRNAVQG